MSLRFDLNVATLWNLPPWSLGPVGLPFERQLEAIAAAGYEGVQGYDAGAIIQSGLRATGLGRALRPEEIFDIAAQQRDAGFEATTLQVGGGLESDAELDRLAEAVLQASAQTGQPLFVETHRATMTQDIRRTVDLVARFPDLRFNGDFSHWYTGHELPYGDLGAKIDVMAPVLSRIRFLHGRIGDSSNIQVALEGREPEPFVDHFRQLWTRSFAGFLATASPGDVIVFAPELLPAEVTFGGQTHVLNYARRQRAADGSWREESDRWVEALRICEIARECFGAAQRSLTID